MQDFKVFESIYRDDLSSDQQRALITSRWVHRRKADNFVRSRLVCRGFNEQIVDKDDIYAGTPMLSSFRCLLTLSMSRGWEMYTGDVSTAFLHADVRDDGIHVEPPTGEDVDSNGRRIVWKLRKAMYGLRSAPRSWQDHFAGVVMSLGMRRMKSDSSVFVSKNCILMAYVDDIFISAESLAVVQEVVQKLRAQLLLKDTGLLKPGSSIRFIGRELKHHGDYIAITGMSEYIRQLLEEHGLQKCKTTPTPGTSVQRRDSDEGQLQDRDETRAFRRLLGKLQWLVPIRPDIAFAVKELARETAPSPVRLGREPSEYSDSYRVLPVTNFRSDQTLRYRREQRLTCKSTPTLTGQDVQTPGDPRRGSSCNSSGLQSVSPAEPKQRWRPRAQRQSSTLWAQQRPRDST